MRTPARICIWSDPDGRNEHAKETWCGQAHWQAVPAKWQLGPDRWIDHVEALVLSVPASVHGLIVWKGQPARALASLVKWRDSVVGLLVMSVGSEGPGDHHVVATAMNLAGRDDLGLLESADRAGTLCAMPATGAELEITPLVRVVGMADALTEASRLRRLTAAEFLDAIKDLRALLRTPAMYGMLGASQELSSLTFNVLQPL
jgi:hypothetical protein